MSNLTSFFSFGWILGIAMFAPVALPAGGAQRETPQVRRRQTSEPFLSIESCSLRSSPLTVAPSIRTLKAGTPMEILRSWESPDGLNWLHVRISEFDNNLLLNSVSHGWLNV